MTRQTVDHERPTALEFLQPPREPLAHILLQSTSPENDFCKYR